VIVVFDLKLTSIISNELILQNENIPFLSVNEKVDRKECHIPFYLFNTNTY
jgi:hypothetical protein